MMKWTEKDYKYLEDFLNGLREDQIFVIGNNSGFNTKKNVQDLLNDIRCWLSDMTTVQVMNKIAEIKKMID